MINPARTQTCYVVRWRNAADGVAAPPGEFFRYDPSNITSPAESVERDLATRFDDLREASRVMLTNWLANVESELSSVPWIERARITVVRADE